MITATLDNSACQFAAMHDGTICRFFDLYTQYAMAAAYQATDDLLGFERLLIEPSTCPALPGSRPSGPGSRCFPATSRLPKRWISSSAS